MTRPDLAAIVAASAVLAGVALGSHYVSAPWEEKAVPPTKTPTPRPTVTPTPTWTPYPTPTPDASAYHWQVTDPCGDVIVATGVTVGWHAYVAGTWRIRSIVTYSHQAVGGGPYMVPNEELVVVRQDPDMIFGAGFEYGSDLEWRRALPCPTATPTPPPRRKRHA